VPTTCYCDRACPGLRYSDPKQVYIAARYGEVFGTQDGGESWRETPLPQRVQHVYALACG
jgi:photosystem II stability/assembly factor-like uncharacterized protein